MVARVTHLALAGPLVVIGDKLVAACASIINAQIRGLGRRIPMVKIRLVISGNDRVVTLLSCRGCSRPTLPWQGRPASAGAGSTAPNPTVKRNPDSQFARLHACI